MTSRRDVLIALASGVGLTGLAMAGRALGVEGGGSSSAPAEQPGAGLVGEESGTLAGGTGGKEKSMKIHYLEVVTPEVDATCAAHEKLHGVSFSEPVAALGNARTAPLPGGGMMGVRAPMHAAETPIVRPYLLVDDIAAAVESAVAAGAELAHPPMELPGLGQFAIYIQGGINHGLWQL